MFMFCLQRNGPSVFMFGFMSLVFTMRERVESSMEMVSGNINWTLCTHSVWA
jgi:hypothetical protein